MISATELNPMAHVRRGRAEAIDDNWGSSRARIKLDPTRFGPETLAGLADFSHLEAILLFDRVPPERIEIGARHPRGRRDWPLVGIFSQRGKNRPNRFGLCTCRIVAVDGLAVAVEGLDAIDGSTVLNMKPVMQAFLPRGAVTESPWVGELMRDYW